MGGMRRIRLSLARACSALLLVLLANSLAPGQVVAEYQVKAAYIYNFAKFIDWPAENFPNPTSPFRFCVLNDQSFQSSLNQITKDKNLAGHPLHVDLVQSPEESRACEILFVNSSQDRHLHHIIETLQGVSVLTVGETKSFLDEGGMITFVLQDQHVQFQVNHKAAIKAGLHISARLLIVAKAVIE